MKHVIQDFKSTHKPETREIEFSFVLEDSGPDVAWPLDGRPIVNASARISPNGQLVISGKILEFDDLPTGTGSTSDGKKSEEKASEQSAT